MTSEVTRRARAFVSDRLAGARGLGQALAQLIDDPDAFVTTLREGLEMLADPLYAAEQERVAPGSGAVIGVRWPLIRAAARQLRKPLWSASSASSVWLAQRLVTEEYREVRLFATIPLERAMVDDPERAWQVLRRLGRAATDWISVDAMADLVARGIIAEDYRWAELEQLVYSDSTWERRLVGSTIARMPFQVSRPRRTALDGGRGLMLIGVLMGDAEPDVQKALGWALREWTQVDAIAVTSFLSVETDRTVGTGDGHRAWVIRDALPAQPPSVATDLRRRLEGIRRHANAPATSAAAADAVGFRALVRASDRPVDRVVARQGERMARIGA